MNKRIKKVSILLSVILSGFILCYVSFYAPYNLRGIERLNIQSFKDGGELFNYFKNYNVTKVKYLGSNSYEVFTDDGEFIVIANYTDSMYWKYKIYKNNDNFQYFTNPM